MFNSSLSLRPALFGNLDLRGQSVEINKQELTKLMHLAGHFFGRFSVAMYGIVSIKPKFVRPSLDLRGNSVFFSQSVDPLLDLPGFDIWRKRLQSELHCLAIHATCGVEVLPSKRGGGLKKYACNWLRNIRRRFVRGAGWKYLIGTKAMSRRHQVSRVTRSLVAEHSQVFRTVKHGRNWHIATTTCCTDNKLLRICGANILRLNGEAHFISPAMRAIVNDGSHRFPCQKEILS